VSCCGICLQFTHRPSCLFVFSSSHFSPPKSRSFVFSRPLSRGLGLIFLSPVSRSFLRFLFCLATPASPGSHEHKRASQSFCLRPLKSSRILLFVCLCVDLCRSTSRYRFLSHRFKRLECSCFKSLFRSDFLNASTRCSVKCL
jgi:hypothetical protein